MSKISIVHIITDLRRGGAEAMLLKLVGAMDRNVFQQTVVVLLDKGELGPSIEKIGIPLIALDLNHVIDFPLAVLRTRSVLKRLKPDIVQTWLYHADLVGTIAARTIGNAKLLWNVRCSNMNLADYSLSMRLIVRALAHLSSWPDAIISNSLTGQETHAQLGYRPRHWHIVPNGFDTHVFRPDLVRAARLRESLGLAPSTPLIGLPARLDPMKDHDNFLDAAALLVRDRPDVRFVLVGRGLSSDNAGMAARIAGRGLTGRVHLAGERSDMEAVIGGLTIATLCSAYGEGFPNVLGEALSCGVPCVATDVGDSAEIVGPFGVIVPPRNPAALAAGWKQMLALSPEARSEQGRRARQYMIDRYSLPAISREYERLYASIVQPDSHVVKAKSAAS